MPEPFIIDGFVITDIDTNEPVHFVACTKGEPFRERVEAGLFYNMNTERHLLVDTRWYTPET